jgi:hypothetical protein
VQTTDDRYSTQEQQICFHVFPKDPVLRKAWDSDSFYSTLQ